MRNKHYKTIFHFIMQHHTQDAVKRHLYAQDVQNETLLSDVKTAFTVA